MNSVPKSFNPNKLLKEEFVSNLTGSSVLEIAVLSTIIPLLILLRRSISFNHSFDITLKKNDNATAGSKRWLYFMATTMVDFLFIVVPIILTLTVLSEWAYTWLMFLLILLLLCVLVKRSCSNYYSKQRGPPSTHISSGRVAMMIITCICILAVDFRIFPRRYAKTETYGTGWMDLGVGSFVLGNSAVSREARNIPSLKRKNALQSATPLIILGIARLLSTRGIDYQVHVAEYGVHWNFFFTLAAISLLTSLISVPPKYCGILGTLILVGYQSCLLNGLNSYLLSNKRGKDIISQNKEGMFSIFGKIDESEFNLKPILNFGGFPFNYVSYICLTGYWGLYLLGVYFSNLIFFRKHSYIATESNKQARIRLWLLTLFFWLLTVLLDRHVERVSRRMCNVAYVTLVLAVNMQVMAILMLSDFIPGSKISVLEEACNRNLLATFFLANVFTGLVNMLMDTIFASSITALSILIVYAFMFTFIIAWIDFCGMRLKFW